MRCLAKLLVVLAPLVLVCGCRSEPEHPGPDDGSALDFTPKATVVVDDAGIQPNQLSVHVGDAVTVTNKGTSPHGLTSDTEDIGTIDTGTLQPGESSTVFFTAPGTLAVHDRFALEHTATIVIAPEPSKG
jgi:plastocyanin